MHDFIRGWWFHAPILKIALHLSQPLPLLHCCPRLMAWCIMVSFYGKSCCACLCLDACLFILCICFCLNMAAITQYGFYTPTPSYWVCPWSHIRITHKPVWCMPASRVHVSSAGWPLNTGWFSSWLLTLFKSRPAPELQPRPVGRYWIKIRAVYLCYQGSGWIW